MSNYHSPKDRWDHAMVAFAFRRLVSQAPRLKTPTGYYADAEILVCLLFLPSLCKVGIGVGVGYTPPPLRDVGGGWGIAMGWDGMRWETRGRGCAAYDSFAGAPPSINS